MYAIRWKLQNGSENEETFDNPFLAVKVFQQEIDSQTNIQERVLINLETNEPILFKSSNREND